MKTEPPDAAPLDIGAFRNAIAALSDALDLIGDAAWFDAQSPAVRRTMVAGAIQSVEFVYELSIKTLRRALERRAASPAHIDHRSFRDMIRTAAEMGFIAVDEVKPWFAYRDMRKLTSHTYDAGKADAVMATAPAFLMSARALLRRVEAANV